MFVYCQAVASFYNSSINKISYRKAIFVTLVGRTPRMSCRADVLSTRSNGNKINLPTEKLHGLLHPDVLHRYSIRDRLLNTPTTTYPINFSTDILKILESFKAIFLLIGRIPFSIFEMCCRGMPPNKSPRAFCVIPRLSL